MMCHSKNSFAANSFAANSFAAVPAVLVLAAVAAGCAQVPGPGSAFRDCPHCPEMVVIPAGGFVMGSPDSEANREPDEGPPHAVSIAAPFAASRFEVTRGEYAEFIRASGYDGGDACEVLSGDTMTVRPGANWANPGFAQTDRHPAVCVSWDDANTYLSWLSRTTGQHYRLLTEAEWEYAARAGTTTPYSFGANPDDLCRYANVRDQTAQEQLARPVTANCRDGYGTTTAPAGSFLANGYGLHDTLGNVWEWVEDCESKSYAGAPADGSAWLAGDCAKRGIRGGSRGTRPDLVRSANRAFLPRSSRSSALGFRVARSLD